jgi:hypothetical protein
MDLSPDPPTVQIARHAQPQTGHYYYILLNIVRKRWIGTDSILLSERRFSGTVCATLLWFTFLQIFSSPPISLSRHNITQIINIDATHTISFAPLTLVHSYSYVIVIAVIASDHGLKSTMVTP